jgi:enoyl-CoA hydratase/carnithine racemase
MNRRNVINDALRGKLVQAIEAIGSDDSIRTLVITGEGSAFCAGGRRPSRLTAGRLAESVFEPAGWRVCSEIVLPIRAKKKQFPRPPLERAIHNNVGVWMLL